MTYVFGGTLSLTQLINLSFSLMNRTIKKSTYSGPCLWCQYKLRNESELSRLKNDLQGDRYHKCKIRLHKNLITVTSFPVEDLIYSSAGK